ncbi:hypothetical protein GQ543_00760 [candidate division WOR-3 bacterium]|nr:hypothetical protein [candidate division WOR-3 bacterium]
MKKLLLLIPLVVLIVGCGSDEEGTVFYPLSVGNEWNYNMSMTRTTPTDTTVETGSDKLEITAETTLDNGTAVFEWVLTITFDDTLVPDIIDTSYIEETEDYILQYDAKTDTVPSDTMLALPLETGKTWADYEVMGQEDVTVPAGTFNDCWEVREVDDEFTLYVYWAPDVGAVRLNDNAVDADTTYEMLMELETYTVQ